MAAPRSRARRPRDRRVVPDHDHGQQRGRESHQAFTLTVNTGGYHLAFVTQPGGGAAGVAWSQQPVVEVLNSLNQVVTTDNST